MGRVGKGYSILFSAFFLSAFSQRWEAEVVGLEGLKMVTVAWPAWDWDWDWAYSMETDIRLRTRVLALCYEAEGVGGSRAGVVLPLSPTILASSPPLSSCRRGALLMARICAYFAETASSQRQRRRARVLQRTLTETISQKRGSANSPTAPARSRRPEHRAL